MNENKSIDVAKNKRRIFDQTASMHFKLSDEYKRWAGFEDAIEIIISIVLCGITFLDFEKYFNVSITRSTLIVGCISIFLLAFTLIKQNLDHKRLCEKHRLAGKMFVQAKNDLTTKISEWTINLSSENDILLYIDGHYSSLNELPQIPEKSFNRLKHAHLSKVAMSKFLHDHESDFWPICRLKFWFQTKKRNK